MGVCVNNYPPCPHLRFIFSPHRWHTIYTGTQLCRQGKSMCREAQRENMYIWSLERALGKEMKLERKVGDRIRRVCITNKELDFYLAGCWGTSERF